MPSQGQHNDDTTAYRNLYHKVFSDSTEFDAMPVIRGIRTKEEAKAAWNEAHRTDLRESLKEEIRVRMQRI